MQTQKPVTQAVTECGDSRAKPFHSCEYKGIELVTVLYKMILYSTERFYVIDQNCVYS